MLEKAEAKNFKFGTQIDRKGH